MKAVQRGVLSEVFEGVAAKRLTLVETITPQSNQHEFQGTAPFRAIFGDAARRRIPTRFLRFDDDETTTSADGFISWSNVREGKPRSPEYHCYYNDNAVTRAMQVGETLFIALSPDGTATIIVTPPDSTTESQLYWLFGLSDRSFSQVQVRKISEGRPFQLNFAARYILAELGIELEAEPAGLDAWIEKFGLVFPTTREFSALARHSLGKTIDPLGNPDETLVSWLDREETLFRILESRVLRARLKKGFIVDGEPDVDDFIAFSLSVQNRRKSRAGQSLELHIEALLAARGIAFARGAVTENGNKPDFLFPGIDAYRDPSFPVARLTMLGSKSSAKDRWRQVLAEARRIDRKHLLTLEPGISEAQTMQMAAENLQLVIPSSLHATFRPAQLPQLMNVAEFVDLVNHRQAL